MPEENKYKQNIPDTNGFDADTKIIADDIHHPSYGNRPNQPAQHTQDAAESINKRLETYLEEGPHFWQYRQY